MTVESDPTSGESPESQESTSDGIEAVGFFQLFRFASLQDKVLLSLGFFEAAAFGLVMPFFAIIFGDLFDSFNDPDSIDDMREVGVEFLTQFCILGAAVFVLAGSQVACFTLTSERQTLRIREAYLEGLLRQEIGWFDSRRSGELAAKVAENTVIIKESMGEKLGTLVMNCAMCIGGFAIGFYFSWKLSLIVLAMLPALAAGGYFLMKMLTELTSQGLTAYAKAGAVAEEGFTNIRTITAFNAQDKMLEDYKKEVKVAEKAGITKGWKQGMGMGFTMLAMYAAYALAFAYGARFIVSDRKSAFKEFPITSEDLCGNFTAGELVEVYFLDGLDELCALDPTCNCGCYAANDCISGGDVILVFFSILMASFALGQAGPFLGALKQGQAAAKKIYDVIDREPHIDDEQGSIPEDALNKLSGEIRFVDVTFAYPTREEAIVINRINLVLEAGKSIALVGGSGSGKSTIVNLIQRFYDPVDGSIFFDNHNLKDFQLTKLRNIIGLVSQEPVLFATTIKENIAFGAVESDKVSDEQIIAAAKAANAYNFIMDFPDQFNTLVGEKGTQISGGQKQRIAIARAIIRNPKILLLDEATSALDTESERVVQKALNKLISDSHMERTTVVIAHRLSTIRNCDKIVVLGEGSVIEEDTHENLLKKKNGAYKALVSAAEKSQGKDFADELTFSEEKRASSAHDLNQASFVKSHKKKLKEKEEMSSENEDKDKTSEEMYKVPFRRVFGLANTGKDIRAYILGCFFAILNGAQMPVFALLFAEIAEIFYNENSAEMRDEARFVAWAFVALGIITAIASIGQYYYFGYVAEKMTSEVRTRLFAKYMHFEVGFFDDEKHSIGAITSGLSTDAAQVKGSVGDRFSILFQNIAALGMAFAIAFVRGWKLTLVLLALFPVLMVASALEIMALSTFAKQDEVHMKPAAKVLQESISGVRTVVAFNARDKVVGLYKHHLEKPRARAIKKGIVGGLGFGTSQAVQMFFYGFAFFYGATLIAQGEMNFADMIAVVFALLFGAMGLGQSAVMAPDVAKGGLAVSNVFKVLDAESKIDPSADNGSKQEVNAFEIVFDNVSFAYPSRPEVDVLKQISFEIKSGETVALVGSSGCGKSSCISLVERFYDVDSGAVLVNGEDIKSYNISFLRSNIGYVEQEPKLFAGTIRNNILFGVNTSDKTEEQVLNQMEQAARSANAHEFISEFPDGYDTMVGEQGAQLSGGQKQRICIARALIKSPKILLLDEATSALDNHSERIVQDALDGLTEQEHVTTIVIAHRLTTIQNADKIIVMDHGVVVESGTHTALLRRGGAYAKLWNAQTKRSQQ